MDGGRKHLRRASLALIAAIAALGAAAPSAAAAAGPSPAEVRDYWTISRMLAAEEPQAPSLRMRPAPDAAGSDHGAASYVPADDAPAVLRAGRPDTAGGGDSTVVRHEVTDPTAPEVRMHGKVFFTVLSGPDAGDRVCSGTVVNSRKRSVVWTAGHCVFDATARAYVSNWVFVPGFSEEGAPYGEWPAKRLKTTRGWRTGANFRFDLGAAVVAKDPQGRRLQELVGARGIGFDQPRDRSYEAYGYPTVDRSVEFPGTREYRCISANAGADAPLGSGPATMAIDCDMPAGASGGGWISGKTLLSVTSYGYVNDPARLYGPYLSKAAKALYRKAAGKQKKKKRRNGGEAGKRAGWTHELGTGAGAN